MYNIVDFWVNKLDLKHAIIQFDSVEKQDTTDELEQT